VPRDKSSTNGDDSTSENGKGSFWMLDPSASDMFDAGNYRRRRTRRQRHAKMLLSSQFHHGSSFIYPELIQRAHHSMQNAQAFALTSLESHHPPISNNLIKQDDDSESDNDAATAESHLETTRTINALDSDTANSTKCSTNYFDHLDKLLKNQFLQQINFKSTINDSNNVNFNCHIQPSTNDCKTTSLKAANFTIENLIKK
jgi:hypothetical protein